MPTQVQFRRGTSAQNNSFTGAAGELSIDSDNNTIRVHDGSTSGGHAVAKRDLSNISNVGVVTATSAIIGSGVTITSGGLNITGVVTATSFRGDGSQLTGIDATVIQTGTTKVQTNAARIDSVISGSTVQQVNSSGIVVTGITTATDFNSTSDETLKKNIRVIENPIEKVLQLNGVTFNWKDNDEASVGVIAQDVEKVFPELVHGLEPKTVSYNGLVGLLIECIKHQQHQINELKEHMIGS